MYSEYAGKTGDAERIDKNACRKYRVVVGCMVSLSVMLGALLLHGAVKAVSNAKSAYIVLYALGFCVIVAVPLLVWNSYRYLQYVEKRQKMSGGYEPLDDWDKDFLKDTQKSVSVSAELLDNCAESLYDYENSERDGQDLGIGTQFKESLFSSLVMKSHDVTGKNLR